MRKAVRIAIWVCGGLLLVTGATGAAAVYIGADKLLGPSSASQSGVACTTIYASAQRRGDSRWIRRFITTDADDGVTQLKTAVRVAHAVQTAEKAQLVQVSVLARNGNLPPSAMRGRAIGAQITYQPNGDQAAATSRLAGFYVDGQADPDGEYHGMRVKLPERDLQAMAEGLTEVTGCEEPSPDTSARTK